MKNQPCISFAASASASSATSATLSLYPRYNYNMIISSYKSLERNHPASNNTISFFTKQGKNGRYFSTGNNIRTQSKSLSVTNVTNSNNNFASVILKSLNDPKNVFRNDENSQRAIENIVFEDYEFNYSANSAKYIRGGINTQILNPMLNKMILDKSEIIKVYINNLLNEQNEVLNNPNNVDKFGDIIKAKIITSFSVTSLFDICITHFLLIYTYQDTEEDKFLASINVSINIGKKMFSKYLNKLKYQYSESSSNNITFTD